MVSTEMKILEETARGGGPEEHSHTRSRQPRDRLEGETRIVIGDPQPIVLEGLSFRLEARSLVWRVVSIAESEPALLADVRRFAPDIVVADLSLCADGDPGLIGRIREAHGEARVLVYTNREIQVCAEPAFRAGALAVVSKSDPLHELDRGLEAVRAGSRYASPLVAAHLLTCWYDGDAVPDFEHVIGALSDREMHVFRMMGEDKGTKEIAAALGVSVKTVETYQSRVAVKLGQRGAARVRMLARSWLDGRRPPGSSRA